MGALNLLYLGVTIEKTKGPLALITGISMHNLNYCTSDSENILWVSTFNLLNVDRVSTF